MEFMLAAPLNNQAIQLERAGNFVGAEALHLEALELKLSSSIDNPIAVAITRNGLGELYTKMGRLDEAQEQLELAAAARELSFNFDTACTRDSLGRLFEVKGDFEKAVEWRTRGAPNQMICSHFDCPLSVKCQFSKRTDLNSCARCKSIFYCGKDCQKKDWIARHKVYCKAPKIATPAAN
ncbi:hypothetical protein LOCC1_G005874 [Lachnellula occidentalis]|uniref:MYND-type domain-containing protein n=1 Tax=Lachnellula occidentalis TaxID=215460 RepID=A0A8H8UE32_9HELO|nr:hypothetical protein LOCC1_G005874 [Lachnellula occidentalis]